MTVQVIVQQSLLAQNLQVSDEEVHCHDLRTISREWHGLACEASILRDVRSVSAPHEYLFFISPHNLYLLFFIKVGGFV